MQFKNDNMQNVKIELNEFIFTCGDGCFTDFGTIVYVNDVELFGHNQDVGTIVTNILTHLGYKVELIETFNNS